MGKVSKSSTFSDNDWEEIKYKSDAKIKEWIDFSAFYALLFGCIDW